LDFETGGSMIWDQITLEQWGDIARLGTFGVAFVAAIIALRAVWIQRDIARRRASVDFFLKTEMDPATVDLYDKFKELGPRIKNMEPFEVFSQSDEYKKVARPFLNICELIAVGINEGAFSERVSQAYWGDVLPDSYLDALPLIQWVRRTEDEGNPRTYADLEKICKRWRRKDERRWWQFWKSAR
jgi:hypothetical protein